MMTRRQYHGALVVLSLVDAEPGLLFVDEAGVRRAALNLVGGEPGLGLFDAAGKIRAILSVVDGEPRLLLSDAAPRPAGAPARAGGRREVRHPRGVETMATRAKRGDDEAPTERVNFTISPAMLKRLDVRARENERTRSAEVRLAIREHLG